MIYVKRKHYPHVVGKNDYCFADSLYEALDILGVEILDNDYEKWENEINSSGSIYCYDWDIIMYPDDMDLDQIKMEFGIK